MGQGGGKNKREMGHKVRGLVKKMGEKMDGQKMGDRWDVWGWRICIAITYAYT